jgi:tRNA1Val (adenine37-N6)-methyltransferase
MGNDFFRFRRFTVFQRGKVFRVGTDGVLLGSVADFPIHGRILDIGTGTGLIALMAAQRTDSFITAIDPDSETCSQANENFAASPWPGRIILYEKSLQDFAAECTERFDFIVSNPPYFRDSLKNIDSTRTRSRHTDSLSPADLLDGVIKLLEEDGVFEVVLPYTEGMIFIAEAADKGLYCNRIIKVKGTPNGKIIRIILKFERNRKELKESFVTIETGVRHSYTKEYMELTRDFYLGSD